MFKKLLIALLLCGFLSGCVVDAEIPGVTVRAHYGDRGYYRRGGYYPDYPVSHHGGYYHRYSDHRDAGHEY